MNENELIDVHLHLTGLEKDTLLAAMIVLCAQRDYPYPNVLTCLLEKIADALGLEVAP